ncbi:MAG TPA: ABC transporter ATP-binding protein [Planctomycetota bacterium]|nr:ABC transporter ATP-binding protein [Planctomycetota bacterium]
MIRIENLTKLYGDKLAVNGLDLEIGPGVFYTFLGPNGAGKTTTMKIMAGLLLPTSGRVFIDGLDVTKEPVEAKSRIGYIPDHPFLYGKLTGWEYLHFVGGLYRMSPEEVRALGSELLGVFALEEEAHRLVETFSHGMRQRLAFAGCFLHRPKVVIIDEPWVGLDPRNIRTAIDFLRARALEGTTIFMSTHSLDIAQSVSERLGILNKGNLLFDGTLDQLIASGEKEKLEEVFLEMTEG